MIVRTDKEHTSNLSGRLFRWELTRDLKTQDYPDRESRKELLFHGGSLPMGTDSGTIVVKSPFTTQFEVSRRHWRMRPTSESRMSHGQ
jgi:hypothetical protein